MSIHVSNVAVARNLALGEYLASEMPSLLSLASCSGRRFWPSSKTCRLVVGSGRLVVAGLGMYDLAGSWCSMMQQQRCCSTQAAQRLCHNLRAPSAPQPSPPTSVSCRSCISTTLAMHTHLEVALGTAHSQVVCVGGGDGGGAIRDAARREAHRSTCRVHTHTGRAVCHIRVDTTVWKINQYLSIVWKNEHPVSGDPPTRATHA